MRRIAIPLVFLLVGAGAGAWGAHRFWPAARRPETVAPSLVRFPRNYSGASIETMLREVPRESLSAEALRDAAPGYLRPPRVGPSDLLSATSRPVHLPGADGSGVPAIEWRLATTLGRFRVYELKPAGSRPPGRLCIAQHGHEGFDDFWSRFRETLTKVQAAGVPVFVPWQTDLIGEDVDFAGAHQLLLLGTTLMGVRVSFDRLLLDHVTRLYPGARVEMVGHSGGSMVAYFTSVVDPRIDALAVDYRTGTEALLSGAMHCESVPGLYSYNPPEGPLRLDAARAAHAVEQPYGYPDREALVRWILDPGKP